MTREWSTETTRKQRNPWTAEEVEALTDYIENLDCSWAEILRRDKDEAGILQARDQYALKDKARNMLFDWLKCVEYPLL